MKKLNILSKTILSKFILSKFILFPILLIFILSCSKTNDITNKNINDLNISSNFDWTTSTISNISITTIDINNNPLQGAILKLFICNPNLSTDYIIAGTTDSTGNFTTNISLPKICKNIYIQIFYNNLTVEETIEIKNIIIIEYKLLTNIKLITNLNNYDSDKDGVSDNYDDYPFDKNKAFNNYTPSKNNYGSLIFEDLFPYTGDYDFNDLVLSYNFNYITDSKNKITQIEATFIIEAIGAGYFNGFGFEISMTPNKVSNVQGINITDNYIELSKNNTESNQPKTVIIVFDNLYNSIHYTTFFNTLKNKPYIAPDTTNITIYLDKPINIHQIDLPPYNPFLIVDRNRNKEIHLPDYKPTNKVNGSDFGTGNDNSLPAHGKFYRTKNGLPWAINLANKFDYMIEKFPINQGYTKFNAWTESSGIEFQDWWYQNNTNYRNNQLIYYH